MWTDTGNLERAARVRFAPAAISEGLRFLEAFVPFHIGKSPKSLKVLRAVRESIKVNGKP
jgi:DNA repair protein RecO (recombination protein O)